MRYRPFSCHDRFCGASDCLRCFPYQQDEENEQKDQSEETEETQCEPLNNTTN